MAFTGHEDHSISLDTASEWTENYRNSERGVEQPILAHYFGKDIINSILGQSGCVGMRIYYAIDDAGKKQVILVGVDANENDLYTGIIADRSIQCPPICGAGNPLNS